MDSAPAPRLKLTATQHRVVVIVALIAICSLISTALIVLTAGAVPRGTLVLGVDIGGRSKAAAATRLRAELGSKLSAPVSLKVSKKRFTARPDDLGVWLDVEATVDRAADRVVNPFTSLFADVAVEPVIRVDEAKIAGAVQAEIAEFTQDMVRPAIRYEGSGKDLHPVAVYGTPGRGVNSDKAAAQLCRHWLRSSVVALPLGPVYPGTRKAEVDTLMRTLARPAIAAPVTVRTQEGAVSMTPAEIATGLVMESDVHGVIRPTIDAAKLQDAMGSKLSQYGVAPKNAVIEVVGDQLKVTPSVNGRGLNIDQLSGELISVLKRSSSREIQGQMGPLAPKLTTEKVNALGVKEKISSFTTYFTGGQDRNKNILLVADEADNALVLPGEIFSLNGYTGERGPAQGYVKAPVIVGGKIKNEYGGGISQFATTLYNAIFFSGLEDAYHRAHGYYISRYPAGREATVYYPSLDLKFRNDSTHGVLIDTAYTDTSITVTFWSTKRYDIESISGDRSNHRPINTVYLENETDCVATEGIVGFDITVYRVFKQGGVEVKRERIFTRYDAEPKFVCGADPNKTPPPPPPA